MPADNNDKRRIILPGADPDRPRRAEAQRRAAGPHASTPNRRRSRGDDKRAAIRRSRSDG